MIATDKFVSLPEFLNGSARSLISYPDLNLSAERLQEIKTLNVTGIYSFGAKRINRWYCLGLGYCGLVILVQYQGRMAALKVRRTDAPQASFEKEAQMMAIANRAQVGPQLLAHTDNFLVMDYAAGLPIGVWLTKTAKREQAISIVFDLMHQAFRLDQIGLDHGNLRCVTEHVVVDSSPIILDFSSASNQRRAANVTTLVQGLLWGTAIAQYLQNLDILVDREQCIQQLRAYKKAPNLNSFKNVLALLF